MYLREKRSQELDIYVNSFKSKIEDSGYCCTLKPNWLTSVLDAYEAILSERIKVFHKENTNINIFKVASGLEMAIIYVSPIIPNDPREAIYLNSLLATELAFTYTFIRSGRNLSFSDLEKVIMQEHHELLTYLEINDLMDCQTLNNSLFLKALHCSVTQRIG